MNTANIPNLDAYLDAIKASYAGLSSPKDEVRAQMIKEFNASVRVDEGNKFLKVVSNGSVHSFIVKEDGSKFKQHDILKAAGWAAPAKNFARGSLVDCNFKHIRWTGA